MPQPGYQDDNPFNLENPSILDIAPPEPKSLEETGLKMGLLSDIALKFLYYSGTGTGMEIADELCLSVNTVKTHIAAIYRKLAAARRRDAVLRARQLELL